MKMGFPGLGLDSQPAWIQASVLGQIAIMVFMPLLMTLFIPEQPIDSDYREELDELLDGYSKMTGKGAASEEIWALAGVYTAYGYNEYGEKTTKYGVTDDGWIYGARLGTYSPFQYMVTEKDGQYVPGPGTIDSGRLGYIVKYNAEKGLYYYSYAGDDLQIDYKYEQDVEKEGQIIHKKGEFDPDHPQLYTRVHMDTAHKSDIFITKGGKHEMDNGTFYYEFSGYRYSFVPLEDYNYDKKTGITAKNSSCSLIWYQYTSDSGIQGQLVISGTDSGIAYITGQSIVRQFDQQTSTAKFTFAFSGVDVYVYIQMDPYALYTMGKTPEECYNDGNFSLMVTTPKYVTSGHQGGSSLSFDINKMWDVLVGLFTFNPEAYGLEQDSTAGIVASIVFIAPLYAALLAMGTICWPILILLAQVQQISSLWPF